MEDYIYVEFMSLWISDIFKYLRVAPLLYDIVL